MQPAQLPLRDIHLPPAIGWWPPAIGWWLLAIAIPLLVWFCIWLYKRLTRNTAIKSAKKELLSIKQNSELNHTQKLSELSKLIRRTTISIASDRKQCAGLTGQAWLEFLDQTMPDAPFSQGIGNLLGDAVYRNNQPDGQEINQLITLCEAWLQAQGKRKR